MVNRNIKLITLDCIGSALSLYFAFLIRFEFKIPDQFSAVLIEWLPWFILSQIIVFYILGLYARIWRYTSLIDLYAILGSSVASFSLSLIFVFFAYGMIGYPRSVLLLYLILNTLTVIALRLSVRVYYSHYHKSNTTKHSAPKKILLLIGAGKTGEKIIRDIRATSRNQYTVVGFVDDNPNKHGALLHGKEIFCSVNELPNLDLKYDELLITMPSANGDQMRRIVKICKQTGKRYKTVPSMAELIDNEPTIDNIRDVKYSDLLGRQEIQLDMNSIESMLQGKRVLITGAGGSIGSELVKQCLTFNPAEIICVDISEEKIYYLEQGFQKNNPNIILKTALASINSKKEIEKIFIDNQPHIVFHAAAYKHVPIQELHPWTAVNTNLGGTLNLVKFCDKYNVKKFVLVSTDKAVNPANVMGATKRAAEKLIQSFNSQSKTEMMAVRFGNVLGSSGSAIPTFQKQINSGGPITITHPEMTRYFMSIQEASQLILQCGAFGKDGEIFLLEMGKPIKIINLAKDLIRLSGFEPEVDIPIVYTGLRPGEKLYEELQLLNEKKVSTDHEKIMILKEEKSVIPWNIFHASIKTLLSAADELDSTKIQILLKQILPTYSSKSFETIKNQTHYSYPIKGEA
tara:strand:- start:31382 stop:33271 length:1890 start_codon:yes stop_codon:yes gene_type:complete